MEEDKTEKAGIRVDVGCGQRENGAIKVDVVPYFRPHLMGSVTELPFAENSVDEVICHHVLEHIPREFLIKAMNEMHRILKPGGLVDIEVPVFPFWQAIADPTHVSFFVPQTFDYFCINPARDKGNSARYEFEVGERVGHMKLYGIEPWEMKELLRLDAGYIVRIHMTKVAA